MNIFCRFRTASSHVRASQFRFSSEFTSARFEDVKVKLTEEVTISKRKRFKQIPINYAVLKHLDTMKLGFVSKSRNRRRGQAFEPENVEVKTDVPPPFNRVGEFYQSAKKWDDLPKNRGNHYFPFFSLFISFQMSFSSPAKTSEIAICGRSNVGKSTLLNTLLNLKKRPQLRARVSDKPGETTQLDFFAVGRSGFKLTICDMPGYGYAFASQDKIENWNEMIVNYLRHRNGVKGKSRGDGGDTFTSPLKRLILLLDARHGLKEIDRQFLKVIYDKKYSVIPVPDNVKVPDEEGNITALSPSMKEVVNQQDRVSKRGDIGAQVADPPKLQIVLTKCDLVERLELVRRVQLLREELHDILPKAAGRLPVVMVSSLEDKGIRELQRELAGLCPQ